jgi:PAS domain S-box-containing protein
MEGALGVITDITERKRAEAEIRRHASEMETVAQVTAAATTTLDMEELLQSVVDLTKERFGLYHAHVYLLDEDDNLVLTAGAGNPGKLMVASGHSIPLRREGSIVAMAGRTRQGVIANNVRQASNFMPNPLLPKTKSELAVPMIVGDRLVGVLDVQDDVIDRFADQDVQIQSTLAGQIATAVQNARLFEQQRENEARLTEATHMARMAYWEYDFATDIFTVSDEWFELLGMTAEAQGGYDLTSEILVEKYIYHEDAEKVGQQVQLAYEADDPNYSAEEEFRFFAVDGEVVVHLVRFRTLKDAEGKTIKLTGANQDITERKRQEAEIQRRAVEMETVAQVSTTATTILDTGELLQSVVDLTKERFGLYHAHIYLLDEGGEHLMLTAGAGEAGRTMVANAHGIPLDRQESLVATAARTRESVIVNDVTLSPSFMANPVLPDTKSEMAVPMIVGGRVIGVLDVQSDIVNRFTEQDAHIQSTLAAQIATAVQNARFFEQTQFALAQTEALYTGSDRVVRATTMQEVLMAIVESTPVQNFDRADLLFFDEPWQDTPVEGSVAIVQAVWEREGEPRSPVGTEYPTSSFPMVMDFRPNEPFIIMDVNTDQRMDDNLRDLMLNQFEMRSVIFLQLVAGGEWIGLMSAQSAQAMVISDEDIRQMDSLADQAANVMQTLRLIEQQQETVERLQEVDRLKQQFLANMSHELRTPLNSIIGYSEVLLDGVDGDLTEDAEEDVEAIHDSGKHLLSIINEILDLAKIEAGQMQLDPQDVDLPQFIKDIVHSGQILVKDKDVALEWVEQSAVPVIQADPIRVRQVLWNLISNAVKFTEAGGVTVTYGMHSDTEVFVRVQDTGIGMNEEGLATIFQRFSQVDGSSTRRAGGTGLGLTITRQLVRMHGGDVYVESEVGVGSTFWFTLPVEIIEKA